MVCRALGLGDRRCMLHASSCPTPSQAPPSALKVSSLSFLWPISVAHFLCTTTFVLLQTHMAASLPLARSASEIPPILISLHIIVPGFALVCSVLWLISTECQINLPLYCWIAPLHDRIHNAWPLQQMSRSCFFELLNVWLQLQCHGPCIFANCRQALQAASPVAEIRTSRISFVHPLM